MTFETEQLLVNEFLFQLASSSTPWGDVQFACEFDYSRGRTDVVVLRGSGELLAFEAKLTDWRAALHQAYRNTCFAHRSFVLLPKQAAMSAVGFCQEFDSRGVGLCYVDCNGLVVLREAPSLSPIEPWLASAAVEQVQQQA
jgi:hypothetical protein